MPLQSSIQTTSRGQMPSLVNTETGQRASVRFRDDFPPELLKPVASLFTAFDGFGQIVNRNAQTLLPAVVSQHNRAAARNTLNAPFGATQAALIAYGQVTAKAEIEAMSVAPSNPSNQPIRNRAVLMFDSAGLPDKARMLSSCSFQSLAGIVEAGCLDNVPGVANPLPDDIVGIGRDRWMLLNHAAKTRLAADHPLQPSPDNPAQFGVDDDAVIADAQTGLDNLKARSRYFDNGEQLLRDIITAVSLAAR